MPQTPLACAWVCIRHHRGHTSWKQLSSSPDSCLHLSLVSTPAVWPCSQASTQISIVFSTLYCTESNRKLTRGLGTRQSIYLLCIHTVWNACWETSLTDSNVMWETLQFLGQNATINPPPPKNTFWHHCPRHITKMTTALHLHMSRCVCDNIAGCMLHYQLQALQCSYLLASHTETGCDRWGFEDIYHINMKENIL